MAEEPVVVTDSAPEDEGVKSDSPTDEGVKSDSPAGTDVDGSSTDDGKDKEPVPSLKEEIETAFAEEKGEAPPTKPEGEPEKDTKPGDGQEEDPLKVPEGIKEGSKAHERFQSLANTNKELVSKTEELDGFVTGMRGMVSDAGLDKDGFRDLLDFARESNTGDPRKALALLDAKRKEILLKVGEAIEAPRVLDDFPDLKEKVENHDLSENDALKLAQAEVLKKQAEQAEKDITSKATKEINFQADVDKYSAEVTAMEAEWKKNDVDYEAKSAILRSKLGDIQKQPPDLWPFLVKQSYEMISAAVQKTSKGVSPDTPVTKEHGGEGGNQEPKTLKEAIDIALGAT